MKYYLFILLIAATGFTSCKKTFRCMNPLPPFGRLTFLAACLFLPHFNFTASAAEADPVPPRITSSVTSNGLPRFAFPYPAAQAYSVFGSTNPAGPYSTPVAGLLSGPTFTVTNPGPAGYYRVSVTPMSSNAAPVRYAVRALDVHAHLFAVTLTIARPATDQVVSLPVWIPGSYLCVSFPKTCNTCRPARVKAH